MKPGQGAGLCLADIAAGVSKDEIQRRWKAHEYGAPPHRPRGQFVAGWYRMKGRQ